VPVHERETKPCMWPTPAPTPQDVAEDYERLKKIGQPYYYVDPSITWDDDE
jgi:hypothetical protein